MWYASEKFKYNFIYNLIKAGCHKRQSRSQSCNQKHGAIRSSDQSNHRTQKQNTNSAYDSVCYNPVKTAPLDSQAEVEVRMSQSQCSIMDLGIDWFVRFCFRVFWDDFHECVIQKAP